MRYEPRARDGRVSVFWNQDIVAGGVGGQDGRQGVEDEAGQEMMARGNRVRVLKMGGKKQSMNMHRKKKV